MCSTAPAFRPDKSEVKMTAIEKFLNEAMAVSREIDSMALALVKEQAWETGYRVHKFARRLSDAAVEYMTPDEFDD